VREAELGLEPGEQRALVEGALVHIIAARASHFGRAPTAQDCEAAMLLLGLGMDDEIPAQHRQALIAARRYWGPRAAADAAKAREMVSRIPRDLIGATPEEIRHRLAMGEHPLHAP
jgi:hypothetical protein